MSGQGSGTGGPFATSNLPHSDYDRAPQYETIVRERDVAVPMRDGVRIVADVYRPDADGPFPVLLAFGAHSKEIQGPDLPATFPAQPAFSTLWVGHMEAGDTRYFVSRGYVHVVASPRGFGKAEAGGSREWDSYDLIEWIAAQPWCNGQIGMAGIGAFAAEQLNAAKQHPPHLKTIFAYDARGAYGPMGGFREEYPGGVMHAFRYLQDHFSGAHHSKGAPGPLTPEREALWREAMANPDYKMYPHLYNVLTFKGQHMPRVFDALISPWDREEWWDEAERLIRGIDIPVHTGAGWYGYTYKTHLSGAQNYFALLDVPKKLTLMGPTHPDRPLRALRQQMLRWYDHWLMGIDSGLFDQPPVTYWLMGANSWRAATDWPLPQTQWTKLYLNSWERLSEEPYLPQSNDEFVPPDSFVQMPPTQTNRVERLRYLTDPLGEDVEIAGPISLTLYAEIDQDDTNWIVVLKDVGPDDGVRTAREGERDIRADLNERELTRGWLKASHRALDVERSKPGRPWHKLTRNAQQKVAPGEINAYVIEILATANLFKRGHRICVEITSLDLPTGVSGMTNVEYIPYHICSSRTTLHRIHHDAAHPSHLLLPVIPG
ncbi:MAG: CocE/NonD family hydrolase [Devosia nanyangense]|uniref:CocE/NonD family hydrolase n=1 Tax=Devosia nanyangense TaxID=1228055 RepID=A0A933NYF7_9HYPH|nr:CocE/NonD family hydrolase [Devosia nanyangense]